ncbi:MAG: recB [Parachlamydiales bacterium]|nr:recB [Parachlamydiales bacterium]
MFDVLKLETPLFGSRLLEASAGTGKTFAIEHVFVRLLLEAPEGEEPLSLEQILAITFTRAAAREMRLRIRANLEKALQQLTTEPVWPYLRPHAQSQPARRRIEDALLGFERAQIFTIHGFCHRSLGQFALQSKMFMPTKQEKLAFRQAIQPDVLDFLEKQQVLCPEQIGRLLGKKRDVEGICDALLDAPNPSRGGSFAQDLAAMARKIQPAALEQLRADFERLRPNYKTTGFKGEDFDEQVVCLAQLLEGRDPETALRRLIFWQGSLFAFLSPANRKVRIKEEFSSKIFDWSVEQLGPLIEQMIDPRRLLRQLRFEWQPHLEKCLEQKGLFSPDYLLHRMKEALDDPPFLQSLQKKYRAAIVDEFQDTDAVQWDIFRRIFLDTQRLFYLVGDPKQSIYRFRQADLYTYFHARRALGDGSLATLDTNFRSTPQLISALNDLFGDEQVHPWLWLPRENRSESYRPVKAGANHQWQSGDDRKPVQFFIANDLFDYVAQEIARLRPHVPSYGSFAILVKDRMQAFEVQSYLQARSLPCWAKNQSPLGRSLAFHALEELFQAIYQPRNASAVKILMSGPFVSIPDEQILPQILEWKAILDREGLPGFFRAFLMARSNGCTVYERIKQRGSSFFQDVFQIIEQMLSVRTLNLESLKRFFRELEAADPDDDAAARRRIENDEEAIQIMTMHASKGLEFDIVFVLGAASRTVREEEEPQEAEAEKLRQLYVALTRARWRLYLPLVQSSRKTEGAESPLDLFWKRSKLGEHPIDIVEKLAAKNPHIGLQTVIDAQIHIPIEKAAAKLAPPPALSLPSVHRSIFSYSSLSHEMEHASQLWIESDEKTVHSLPRGSETGILLHRIFERILTSRTESAAIVHQELRLSILRDWEEPVQKMVQTVLTMPLFEDCALIDCPQRRVETEFLFAEAPHFFKGFVDLIFQWKGKLYFLDWKTNYLGSSDESYSVEQMKQAMNDGDYWFQASLYAEALQKAWPSIPFGGAVYLFLRGVHAPSRGTLFFQPTPVSLDERIWKH